jgi:Universal stress protein family
MASCSVLKQHARRRRVQVLDSTAECRCDDISFHIEIEQPLLALYICKYSILLLLSNGIPLARAYFDKECAMEKILVVMGPARPQLSAGIHALNLARRINAKVLFLLVFPSPSKSVKTAEKKNEAAVKKSAQALIEEARSDGIAVDYYLTHGDYESELVSFVQEQKITLLIVEFPAGQGDSMEASKDFLEKLRHRINCRIEVVNDKTETPQRKE